MITNINKYDKVVYIGHDDKICQSKFIYGNIYTVTGYFRSYTPELSYITIDEIEKFYIYLKFFITLKEYRNLKLQKLELCLE